MSQEKKIEYPGFFIKEFAHGFQSYKTDGDALVFSATLGHCKYWTEQVLKAEEKGGWKNLAPFVPFGRDY